MKREAVAVLLAFLLFSPALAQDFGDPTQIIYAAIVFLIVFALGQMAFKKFLSTSSYGGPSETEKRTAIMIAVGLAALVSFFMFQAGMFEMGSIPSIGGVGRTDPFWYFKTFINTMNPAVRIAIALVLFYTAYDRGKRIGGDGENNVMNLVLFLAIGTAALVIANPFWDLGQAVLLLFGLFVGVKVLSKFVTTSTTSTSYSYDRDSRRREREERRREEEERRREEERREEEEERQKNLEEGEAFRTELINMAEKEGVDRSTAEQWVKSPEYYAEMTGLRNFRKRNKEKDEIREMIRAHKRGEQEPEPTEVEEVSPLYTPENYDVASHLRSAQGLAQDLETFYKIAETALSLNARELPDGLNMWALPVKCPEQLAPFPDKAVRVLQQGTYTPRGPFKKGDKMAADKGQLARELFYQTGIMSDQEVSWLKKFIARFAEATGKFLKKDYYHTSRAWIDNLSETVFLVTAFRISNYLDHFCQIDKSKKLVGGELNTYVEQAKQVLHNELGDPAKEKEYYEKSGLAKAVNDVIKITVRLKEKYEAHLEKARGIIGAARRAKLFLKVGGVKEGLLTTMVKSSKGSVRHALKSEARDAKKYHEQLTKALDTLKNISDEFFEKIEKQVKEARKEELEELKKVYEEEIVKPVVDPFIKEFKNLSQWANYASTNPHDYKAFKSLEGHKPKDLRKKVDDLKKKAWKKLVDTHLIRPPASPSTKMERVGDYLLRKHSYHVEARRKLRKLMDSINDLLTTKLNDYENNFENLLNRFKQSGNPLGRAGFKLNTMDFGTLIRGTDASGNPIPTSAQDDAQQIKGVLYTVGDMSDEFSDIYDALKFLKEEALNRW